MSTVHQRPLNYLQLASWERLAVDGTARTTDKFGRLHISKSHISKATVNPYYGSEIPNSEKLGLIPTQVYYMFRDPIELARGASTFVNNPILSKHVPVSADAPRKDLQVGTVGSDVEFNDPYLDADVCIWDSAAIAGIESDQVREFSCAYSYVAVMEPGEYHGQRYDGRMTEIHGNHLALVEAGRAGSDVLAADEEITPMAKTTKLGKALIVTLGGMSTKLAQDAATVALVGMAKKKTFNKVEMSKSLIALDSELDPNKLALAFDALLALDADKDEKPAEDGDLDDETVPGDEDETEEEKKKRLAKDAEEKAEKDKTAMDATIASVTATVTQNLHEADEARRAVRPVVGDVIGMDSAEAIYGFALDEMKVDRKGVKGVPSLRAIFNLASKPAAPAPRMAQDSADSLVAAFGADVARFRSL